MSHLVCPLCVRVPDGQEHTWLQKLLYCCWCCSSSFPLLLFLYNGAARDMKSWAHDYAAGIRGWAIHLPGLWSDYCISCVKTAPMKVVRCWLDKALLTKDSLYGPHASTHSFIHWTPCEVILAGSGVSIGTNDPRYPVLDVRYCELYSRGGRDTWLAR